MDDKRFDSLTRALASGASRRKFLLGLLGVGGVAVVGAELDAPAEAARRPTPTPTPIRCPGNQTPVNGVCTCPATAPSKCGPDCCTKGVIPVNNPGYSECCDNACCFGTCYGEELCCATNNRGTAAPSNRICPTPTGPECCLYSDDCCTVDGCCGTTCFGGADGKSFCCDAANYCPGGTTSPERCCTGATPIKCACGTNANACIADSDEACCVNSDCDTPPDGFSQCAVGVCTNNVCSYTDCSEGSICCPNNLGVYACRVGDECCLTNQDCADTCEACVNFVCVDDPVTFPCGPASDPDKYCCPASNYSICCGATQFECCGVDAATGVTRECDADGKCCEPGTPYFCAGSNTCCVAPCVVFGETEYCCPPGRGRVCDGADSFVCCPNAQECSDDGECCAAGTVSCADECCASGSICCATAAGADGDCCPTVGQCNTDGECCPAGSTVCAGACCSGATPQCCNDICVAASVECCQTSEDCDGECESCVNGACVSDQDKCFGACSVCVNGTCQGDESLCLACEDCQFNPDTNTGVCVDTCTGCADCRVTDTAPTGACVPDNTECLSCQLCQINDTGTGGTCIDNCQGCGNCVPTPGLGIGECIADNSQCPATEVCCVNDEDEFECEPGPNCGCDNNQQCAGLTDPATCKVGVCNAGICETDPAPNTTVCHPAGAGANATCDPAVLCNGQAESCPGPDYAEPGTDCGACMACNATGICTAQCGADEDCCPDTDKCVPDGETCCTSNAQCTADCEICDVAGGYCVSDCEAGEKCCPGTDNCVPSAATCCDDDTDCSSLDRCDGLVWHNFSCGDDGYCVDTPTNCADSNLCTNNSCSPVDGCLSAPVMCTTPPACFTLPGTCDPTDGSCDYTPVACTTPPVCFTGPGTCDPADGQCDYTPVVCNNPGVCEVGPGTCNPADGLCDYPPLVCDANQCLVCQNSQCVTDCPDGTTCDGAGSCIPDCTPVGEACDAGDTCCAGICCGGVCALIYTICGSECFPGQVCCQVNQECVVNADCCGVQLGLACCRDIGGGLECKPGSGQCNCDSDADCAVIPNQPTCVNGTCE